MLFNEKEIEIIKSLIFDWGFEYMLRTNIKDVKDLAKKLNIDLKDIGLDDTED